MTSFDLDAGERAVTQISRRRSEPGWMTEMRVSALRRTALLFAESSPGRYRYDQESAMVQALAAADVRADPADRSSDDGVVFCDLGVAVREHPEVVQQHFGTVVGIETNPFATLTAALWSGGWFVHVSAGVDVSHSLQIDTTGAQRRAGPFERTLIVIGERSHVGVVDGCSAPRYMTAAVQAGVTEMVVGAHARLVYSSLQYWSTNVDNVMTKRARLGNGAQLEWTEGNLGAGTTLHRPAVELAGTGATADVLTLALAGPGQHHETGAEVVHGASDTTSTIVDRSVGHGGGTTRAAGVVRMPVDVLGASSTVDCDALVLDDESSSTVVSDGPCGAGEPLVTRRSSLSRIDEDPYFYLASRGLSDADATAVFVTGFIDPSTSHLSIEDAVEWSRLVELHVDRAIG